MVGSENPVKLEATREAFLKYFSDVKIEGVKVPSGVPDQPLNEDTFRGAENRVEELKRINEARGLNADFFVGIEGGVIELYSVWFGFGVACVMDKSGKKSFGTSSLFPLPEKFLKPVLEGKELGEVVDEYTGRKNIKKNEGAIGILTRGVITRKDLYVPAVISALIPHITELY